MASPVGRRFHQPARRSGAGAAGCPLCPADPGSSRLGRPAARRTAGPSAWTSADGVAWTRTSALDGVAAVGSCVPRASSSRLTRSDRIASWRSSDGVAWSRGTFPGMVPCCGVAAMAELPGGTLLGAIAVSPRGAGTALRPGAFETRDAETWNSLDLPSPPEACVVTQDWKTCPVIATAVAADAEHVVVAGSTATAQAGAACERCSGPRPTAAGRGRRARRRRRSCSTRRNPDRMQNGVYGLLRGWPERVLRRRPHPGRRRQRLVRPPVPANRPVTTSAARAATASSGGEWIRPVASVTNEANVRFARVARSASPDFLHW